jgi:phage-related protein
MADSVGKISLDLELQGDLTKQINEVANKIGEQLKGSLQGINFNSIAESLSNSIKKSMESTMKGIQESLEKTINKAISGATSTSRRIKVPIDYATPSNSAVPRTSTLGSISSPRAPPTAKVSSGVNFEAVKTQIDNLTQGLDITNAKIEQQKIKLQGLKETYASTFNEAQKNKLQDQILKTEATINKLASASDKAGFKLADLDNSMNSLGNSAKKASSSVNTLGNTAKNSTSKASSGMNMISRMLDRMIIRMFLFNTVMKAITAFGTFLGSALMTNTQFANSLLQIKTNLEVAFMPIYQAVLPAINALMRGLSTVTAYIAAFINVLFGKTYQASYGAAKSLNTSIAKMKETGSQSKKTASDIKKAAKEATGALAGFDEINQLSLNKPAATGTEASPSSGGGVSVPALKAPSVDLSSTSVAMQKIEAIVAKLKKIGPIVLAIAVGIGTAILAFKIGTWISNLGGFTGAVAKVGSGIGKVWAILAANPIVLVITIIAGLVAAFIVLYKTNADFRNKVNAIWASIKSTFSSFSSWLNGAFSTDWTKRFGVFGEVLNAFFRNIKNIFSSVKQIFGGIIDFIAGVFTGNWKRAWNGVINIFAGIMNGLRAVIKSPLNAVISGINILINGLNKIHFDVPSWVPKIGGKGFGINISRIPYLAQGGIIDQPTLAMVGERGKEAVMPLENNTGWIDTLASKLNSKGQSSDEIAKLLQIIIDILRNLNLDIDIDGDNLGKVLIKKINKLQRQAGRTLINI